MTELPRIYLSAPDLGGREIEFVQEAFDTNWVAPLGPNVDAFEREFCELVGCQHALALSSGTAALHLALILNDVGPGDEVFVSSLTFVASVNPIVYQGATPVLIDSDEESWNMDPDLLAEALEQRAKAGKLPKVVIVVHLYGQSADLDRIVDVCARYDVPLIEDAAEALGASYKGRSPGVFGQSSLFSFNGNKIITTSGGGMLVSDDADFIAHARKLSTQARDPAPHYQHTEVGYNYRLSNVCAGIGRGQLPTLEGKVARRREHFARYEEALGELPGVTMAPEASWAEHTRWLTCLTIDSTEARAGREAVREHLEALNIEARPVWKPMHLQPLFEGAQMFGGAVSERLFEQGLCLPSGSGMSDAERQRVIDALLERLA